MTLAWVQKIREITSNDSHILTFNDLPSLLYSWKAFTKDMSEPKAWLNQFIINDHHFVSVIRNFKTSKYTTFLQDVVGLTEEVFDRKVITDFLDLEVCRERLEHLDFKKFSLAEQQDLRLLQDRLKEWLPG